ncbi:MAG: hypothetical protein ACOYMA_20540 [Bacteroidia bacterium]
MNYPEISISETQFSVPNTCSGADADAIYENALALWSEAYQNFAGTSPQAILIDLEKLDEQAENGDAIVKVSAFVGEAQENEELSPCDNVTFPTGNYVFLKSQANSTNFHIGTRMTAKLNSKLYNNSCVYYENVKEVSLTSSQKNILTGKTALNKADIEGYYCQILALLQGLNLPSGYQIQSILVTSDMLIGQNGGNGAIIIKSLKIGIPKFKSPPCDVVPPPNG